MSVASSFEPLRSPGFLYKLRAGVRSRLRAGLLIIALVLFLGFTLLALTQPLRPDPYQGGEFLSLSWWLHPYERNAANRLPAFEADMKAIYALPDASRVWVVGTRGLVAYSTNGGGTWIQQRVGASGNTETEDLTGVFFNDDQKGWILSTSQSIISNSITDTLFTTQDGGASWKAETSYIGNTIYKTGTFLVSCDRISSTCFTATGGDWYVEFGGTEVRNVTIDDPTDFNHVPTEEKLY